MWTRSHISNARRVIALDGKTVRGARSKSTTAPQLVAALDHNIGVVLGQLAITTKSNEIPAVQGLLEFFDLTDVVVTVDAMHTQTDTAAQITDAGGDYVFTVKANQPQLHKGCKALPWKDISATSTPQPRSSSDTHAQDCRCPVLGHVHRRSPDRTSTTHGHKTQQEDRRSRLPDHLRDPSSRTTSNPRGLVQGHWGIENRIHWVRDVTVDEDRSQVRTRNAPKVMATMRNTAISLLRLRRREHRPRPTPPRQSPSSHHKTAPDQTRPWRGPGT